MKKQLTLFDLPEPSFTRKGPRLPSGPFQPALMHCQSLDWKAHALCFERKRGRLSYACSVASHKTSNPDMVTCPSCLEILRETSLYNALRTKKG